MTCAAIVDVHEGGQRVVLKRRRLMQRRKALGHTQDDLAALVGVSEVPGRADGYALLSSVSLDFSDASAAVSLAEGFSAHDLASRRQVLEQLTVLSSAALLKPIREWGGLAACGTTRADQS